jgi:hypothetical protein
MQVFLWTSCKFLTSCSKHPREAQDLAWTSTMCANFTSDPPDIDVSSSFKNFYSFMWKFALYVMVVRAVVANLKGAIRKRHYSRPLLAIYLEEYRAQYEFSRTRLSPSFVHVVLHF